MIILVNKSELFTKDPAVRFSAKYKVSAELWREMWRRYKLLGYSISELGEYFEMKTTREISHQNLKRWLLRSEIHSKIKPALDKGCVSVNSDYFGELEWKVIGEITKNIKSSVKKTAKTLP